MQLGVNGFYSEKLLYNQLVVFETIGHDLLHSFHYLAAVDLAGDELRPVETLRIGEQQSGLRDDDIVADFQIRNL